MSAEKEKILNKKTTLRSVHWTLYNIQTRSVNNSSSIKVPLGHRAQRFTGGPRARAPPLNLTLLHNDTIQ